MPAEHKTLEQRIADIEFNLKKLREEITNAYISWEGKIEPRTESSRLTSVEPANVIALCDSYLRGSA
jgi:hypothetical protein